MIKRVIKKTVKNIFWKFYGCTIVNPKLPSGIKSILFVCKGNICRSNFAEMLAYNKYNNANEYLLNSAGILVNKPIGPPEEAIIAARKYDVDIHNRKSRQLDYALMESSDLVAVMEACQYKYLRKLFLEYQDKIFLLPLIETRNKNYYDEYSQYNIKDPYGKAIPEFIECYNRIERCIDILFSDMKHNIKEPHRAE